MADGQPDSLTVQDLLADRPVPLDSLVAGPARAPLDPAVMAFIAAFSRTVLRSKAARRHPEVMALAHWMRPAALQGLAKRFREGPRPGYPVAARGLALHFAPANVDTIFLYSCLLSLMMGNPNIVRLSATRRTAATDLLLGCVGDVLAQADHAALADSLRLISYPRDDRVTAALSRQALVRVIWGGDQTVQHIRSLPLHPLGRDLAFPDRTSVAVLDAAAVAALDPEGLDRLAEGFVNDGYWFFQMACSSPRAVLWLGAAAAAEAAARRFWPAVRQRAVRFSDALSPTDYYRKRLHFDGAVMDGLAKPEAALPDDLVTVASADAGPLTDAAHPGAGYFVQRRLATLTDLGALLDIRCQTIASFGIGRDLWADTLSSLPRLADRVVPVGQALTFDPVWDGMDLMREFTRVVAVGIDDAPAAHPSPG